MLTRPCRLYIDVSVEQSISQTSKLEENEMYLNSSIFFFLDIDCFLIFCPTRQQGAILVFRKGVIYKSLNQSGKKL